MHLHKAAAAGEGQAANLREALLCATANGNWMPTPYSGGGIKPPSMEADAMQFQEALSTGTDCLIAKVDGPG